MVDSSITIDSTITLTIVVALCAIVSPILTALINNAHHTKIRKLELKEQHQQNNILHERELYETFLRNAGRFINHPDATASKDYGESYFVLLSCVPDDIHADLVSINKQLVARNGDGVTSSIEAITPKIHKILTRACK